MIALEGVTHRLGGRIVLAGLDLALAERRIGVVGANGSGKSTFARLLNGLQVPSEGRVLVDGLDTRREGRAVRRRVGFVFQNPDHQIVYPTVEEDLAFGLRVLKLDRQAAAARVETALQRFGLAALRERPAHLLSGGEKQLLAIAGALVSDPATVVFDEPTTLLDRRNARLVGRLIEGLEPQAIVVTHDLGLLDGFDRVLVIDAGRIACDAPPGHALPFFRRLMDRP